MRKTFARLDDVLIERLFQPAADLITNWIRIGCGPAACFCLDLASLSWIVSRAPRLSAAMAAYDGRSAFLDLSFLLLGLVALISLRTLFRRMRGKQGNPLRMAMQPHRAVVLIMLAARLLQIQAPGLPDAADVAMLTFVTFALYLSACASQPPVRRALAVLLPAS
jgi:hypothetical protein